MSTNEQRELLALALKLMYEEGLDVDTALVESARQHEGLQQYAVAWDVAHQSLTARVTAFLHDPPLLGVALILNLIAALLLLAQRLPL
jgi:membrane-bound ClpP family serine protease